MAVKDIFKHEISEGDIVCYAARNGSRQELNFAIVLRVDDTNKAERNLTIRGLDFVFFHSGYYRLKNETQATAAQLWVIREPERLPEVMLKCLQTAYDLHLRREQKRIEDAQKPKLKLSAGERYKQNVENKKKDARLQHVL